MKKLLSRTLALTFVLLLAFSALASSLPSPSEDFYYYDAAGVLDYETEAVIYYNNVELQKATGSQIVVAAVDTTGSLSRQQYAYRLASKWAVGDKKKDNGFLLLLAVGDDDYFLAQGDGTNAIISAGALGDMLYDYLEPDFAVKNYSAGVEKVFEQLFKTVTAYYGANLAYLNADALVRSGKLQGAQSSYGGYVAPEGNTRSDGTGGAFKLFIIVVILVILVVVVFRHTRRRTYRPGPTVVVAPRPRMFGFFAPRAPRPRAPRPPRAPSGGYRSSGRSSGFGSFSSGSSSRSSGSSSRSSGGFSSGRSSGGFGGGHSGGGSFSGGGAGRR